MKYIFFTFEDEKFYIELDLENTPVRQIIINKENKAQVSCREDCLAEGEIDINDIDEDFQIEIIENEQFEYIWNLSIKHYKKEWEETKIKYAIGSKVKGHSVVLYPQGAMIKGNDFYAIYNSLVVKFTNQKIEAKVKGYDEKNMWLILE